MASLLLQSQSLTHFLPQNLFHEPRKSPACPPCPVNLGLYFKQLVMLILPGKPTQWAPAWCWPDKGCLVNLSWRKCHGAKSAHRGKEKHAGHRPGCISCPSVDSVVCHHLQGPPYRNAPGWLPSLQRDSPVQLAADGCHSRWEVITPREWPQTHSLRSWLKGYHVRWAAVLASFTNSTRLSHLWA